MSKALVIKGANFEENKVTTIILSEPIPCTTLSVSPAAITFTAVGQTQQISATILPANTTDALRFVSSDESVATVSDNGLVTCVGIGQSSITITCGDQTQTIVVSASVSIDANVDLSYVDKFDLTSTDLNANPPKDYLGVYAKGGGRIYASDDVLEYKAFNTSNASFDNLYGIKIPKNTKKIVFTYPTKFVRFGYALLDSNQNHTYSLPIDSARVLAYSGMISNVAGGYTLDLTGYESIESFIFSLQSVSYDADTITGDVTIAFSDEAVE